MNPASRRVFLLRAVATTAVVGASANVRSLAQPAKVEETDPQAVALGYKHDTTKVDAKKYPNHTAAQQCSNCQLVQGKAADAWGGCAIFGGKLVAGQGWCSAWVKKA